jgi:hypothetical protein
MESAGGRGGDNTVSYLNTLNFDHMAWPTSLHGMYCAQLP